MIGKLKMNVIRKFNLVHKMNNIENDISIHKTSPKLNPNNSSEHGS